MQTLTTDQALAPADLPADPDLLPDDDRALLDVDQRELWHRLNSHGRLKMLTKARKTGPARLEAARRRSERERLNSEYIDALCKMPPTSDPRHDEAWADVQAKKAAYLALKTTSR